MLISPPNRKRSLSTAVFVTVPDLTASGGFVGLLWYVSDGTYIMLIREGLSSCGTGNNKGKQHTQQQHEQFRMVREEDFKILSTVKHVAPRPAKHKSGLFTHTSLKLVCTFDGHVLGFYAINHDDNKLEWVFVGKCKALSVAPGPVAVQVDKKDVSQKESSKSTHSIYILLDYIININTFPITTHTHVIKSVRLQIFFVFVVSVCVCMCALLCIYHIIHISHIIQHYQRTMKHLRHGV